MRSSKKVLSLLLLVCLLVTMIPYHNVEAAVKLNKTKLSLNVGKTYQLKVKGSSAKVKWLSKKPSVATVSSTGKITAKKPGVAKIVATVKSKNYTCSVTVKKPVVTNYSKKVTYKTYETPRNFVAIVKNGNNVNLRLDATIVYYDTNGTILSSDTNNISCFQAGKESVISFKYPRDSNYEKVDFATFKINLTVKPTETYYKSYVGKIQINANKNAEGGVSAECVNTGSKFSKFNYYTCVYYLGDTMVGINEQIGKGLEAGNSDIVTFKKPFDSNYNEIEFDNYKIYVNSAFTIV